jgi:hypothetical protein
MGRDRREGRLEASEPMSEPLRFKPVNLAHEMIYSTDGGWVSWEDYARLKAEVKELKSQPDPLTAYLYAAELAKDDIKRLKAQVERLTKAGDNLVYVVTEHPVAEPFVKAWFTAKEGKQS